MDIQQKIQEIKDKLKDFYVKLEDKFYDLMDVLDKQGIPVYKLVDWLDKNNIPAFPAVTGSVLLILILFTLFMMSLLIPATSTLTLTVQDSAGPLGNAFVLVTVPDMDPVEGMTDYDGIAELKIPINKEVSLEVSKDGYKIKTEAFTASETESQWVIILEKEVSTLSKTIKLMKEGTQELVTDSVQINLSCHDTDYSQTLTVTGGTTTVDVPDNCGLLYTTVVGDYTSDIGSIDIETGESFELFLAPNERETGSVTVSVTGPETMPLIGIEVSLMTEQGSTYTSKTTTASGTVEFLDVASGRYYVSTYDPNQQYAEYSGYALQDIREVPPNQTTSFQVSLSERTTGKIKVEVVDQSTNLPIPNATVTLMKDTVTITQDYTDVEGRIVFGVGENVNYELTIDMPGYLVKNVANVRQSEDYKKIFLEEATAINAQSLEVSVVDEKGEPVENVRLALKQSVDGTQVGDELTTGANGVATFARLEEGSYYVYAYKPGFGEKTSDTLLITLKEENKTQLVLPIGTGSLTTTVMTEEGAAVPGAKVEIYDYYLRTKLDEKLTESDGIATLKARADKTIFAVIKHSDYTTYTTAPITMAKDVTKDIDVALVSNISSTSVELLGLYTEGQEALNALTPGQKYTARLQLRIPKESMTKEAGVHFRVGSEESSIMERDNIVIRDVRAATPRIVRGSSWNPFLGYATDTGHLTSGDSKWIDALFLNPVGGGVFEVETDLQVRDAVTLGLPLDVRYRGWTKNGVYSRFPVDAVLGTSETVADRQALYANTKSRTYSAGASSLCNETFCNILNVQDMDTGLQTAIVDEYPAKVSARYKFSFLLQSLSSQLYPNSELIIKNDSDSLDFGNYSIVDVTGLEQTGVGEGSEVRLQIGNFGMNDDVFGDIEFKTTKEGLAFLDLIVVSEGTQVFEKNVKINVEAAKEMDITILPKTVIPFINNNLIIQAKDSASQSTIKGANIELYKNGGLLVSGKTNGEGIFSYILPAPSTGEIITLIVEKNGYKRIEKEVTVSENIMEVTPYKINELLTIGTTPTKEVEVIISNVTNIPLVVTEVSANGYFRDYIKLVFEKEYGGLLLEPGQDFNVSMNLSLTEAGIRIDEPTTFDGSLDVVVENSNYNRAWTTSVPLELRIGFGDEVDDGECFTVTPLEVDIFASDNPKNYEFSVVNDCKVNGQPVALRNLQANLVQREKNSLGEFVVTSDLEDSMKVKLDNKFQRISKVIPEEGDAVIRLTFNPDTAATGEGAAQITFRALNLTEAGEEKLDQKVKANIKINNLAECIEFVNANNIVLESAPTNLGQNFYNQYNPNAINQSQNYPGSYPSYVVPSTQTVQGQTQLQGQQVVQQGTVQQGQAGMPVGQYATQPMYNQPNFYQPSNYSPYPSVTPSYYNPQTNANFAGSTSSPSHEFTIRNNCVSAIEISLESSSGINLDKSTLKLSPNSEDKVTVSSSYFIGKHEIKAYGRVSGSNERSSLIKRIPVNLESSALTGYGDCISISPARTISFNDFIQKPAVLTIYNTCVQQGIFIPKANNSINFTNKEMVEDWMYLGDRIETGPDNKSTQVVQFEIVKKMKPGDLSTVPTLPTSEDIFTSLGQLRIFLTSGYYRLEARGNLIVNFNTKWGTKSTQTFPIIFQDFFELAGHLSRLVSTGDPSFTPQMCIATEKDLLNLKKVWSAEQNECIPHSEFEGDMYTYNTQDNGGLFKLATETPEGEKGGCGNNDKISGLRGNLITQDGVEIRVIPINEDHDLKVEINTRNWNGRRINLEQTLSVDVTRQTPLSRGTVRVPLKLCILEDPVRLREQAATRLAERDVCSEAKKGQQGMIDLGLDKISLEWNYDNITSDYCDAPEGKHCDPTQFTLANMKKMEKLKQFIGNNVNEVNCKASAELQTPGAGTVILEVFKGTGASRQNSHKLNVKTKQATDKYNSETDNVKLLIPKINPVPTGGQPSVSSLKAGGLNSQSDPFLGVELLDTPELIKTSIRTPTTVNDLLSQGIKAIPGQDGSKIVEFTVVGGHGNKTIQRLVATEQTPVGKKQYLYLKEVGGQYELRLTEQKTKWDTTQKTEVNDGTATVTKVATVKFYVVFVYPRQSDGALTFKKWEITKKNPDFSTDLTTWVNEINADPNINSHLEVTLERGDYVSSVKGNITGGASRTGLGGEVCIPTTPNLFRYVYDQDVVSERDVVIAPSKGTATLTGASDAFTIRVETKEDTPAYNGKKIDFFVPKRNTVGSNINDLKGKTDTQLNESSIRLSVTNATAGKVLLDYGLGIAEAPITDTTTIDQLIKNKSWNIKEKTGGGHDLEIDPNAQNNTLVYFTHQQAGLDAIKILRDTTTDQNNLALIKDGADFWIYLYSRSKINNNDVNAIKVAKVNFKYALKYPNPDGSMAYYNATLAPTFDETSRDQFKAIVDSFNIPAAPSNLKDKFEFTEVLSGSKTSSLSGTISGGASATTREAKYNLVFFKDKDGGFVRDATINPREYVDAIGQETLNNILAVMSSNIRAGTEAETHNRSLTDMTTRSINTLKTSAPDFARKTQNILAQVVLEVPPAYLDRRQEIEAFIKGNLFGHSSLRIQPSAEKIRGKDTYYITFEDYLALRQLLLTTNPNGITTNTKKYKVTAASKFDVSANKLVEDSTGAGKPLYGDPAYNILPLILDTFMKSTTFMIGIRNSAEITEAQKQVLYREGKHVSNFTRENTGYATFKDLYEDLVEYDAGLTAGQFSNSDDMFLSDLDRTYSENANYRNAKNAVFKKPTDTSIVLKDKYKYEYDGSLNYPNEPGIYKVTNDYEFKLTGGRINTVTLEKARNIDNVSILHYLPFNGIVKRDSDTSNTGNYGLKYTSGWLSEQDLFFLNKNNVGLSKDLDDSRINVGTNYVWKDDKGELLELLNDNDGRILQIEQKESSRYTINFSPIDPVALQVTFSKTHNDPAKVVGILYKFLLGGGIQGEIRKSGIIDWTVVRDQIERKSVGSVLGDRMLNAADMGCGRGLTGTYPGIMYVQPQSTGVSTLKTVVFAPTRSSKVNDSTSFSVMCGKDQIAGQYAEFKPEEPTNPRVSTNPFSVEHAITLNESSSQARLRSAYSLRGLLDLMKDEYVCAVQEKEGDTITDFKLYWNKPKILEKLPTPATLEVPSGGILGLGGGASNTTTSPATPVASSTPSAPAAPVAPATPQCPAQTNKQIEYSDRIDTVTVSGNITIANIPATNVGSRQQGTVTNVTTNGKTYNVSWVAECSAGPNWNFSANARAIPTTSGGPAGAS